MNMQDDALESGTRCKIILSDCESEFLRIEDLESNQLVGHVQIV